MNSLLEQNGGRDWPPFPFASPASESANQFRNRHATVGNLHRPATLRGVNGRRRNAQGVTRRRPNIAREVRLRRAALTIFIRRADRLTTLQTAAANWIRKDPVAE